MRFQDRDAMAFKVFRKDADGIYPTRLRGAKLCEWLFTNIPSSGEAVFMIVPSQREDRKNGYWLKLSFKDGAFRGGTISMVRNFLPIGVWPTFIQGRDVYEQVENAWAEFKDMSAPEMEFNFKDAKLEMLTKCGQTEWADFLRNRDCCVTYLTNMSIEYLDNSVEFSTEVTECVRKFEAACDKYEREHWGKVEFEDPCPVKEFYRYF